MCPFCEDIGHLHRLDPDAERSMFLAKTRGKVSIVAEHHVPGQMPFRFAMPINYCPFCKRDLRGDNDA